MDNEEPSTSASAREVTESEETFCEARKISINRCIKSVVHSCQCRDENCSLPACLKMKRVISHAKLCRRKVSGGCQICKQFVALCCYHAKNCQEVNCPIPFCANIKYKLSQQGSNELLEQNQLLRRRVRLLMMQMASSLSLSSPLNLTQAQNLNKTQPDKIYEILKKILKELRKQFTPPAN